MPTVAYSVVSAMLTPAVMISACAGLMISTSNRLGRVVDRVRNLSNEADQFNRITFSEDQETRRQLVASQLTFLSRRLMLLRGAVVCLYSAVGLFIAASIGFGMLAIIDIPPAWWIPMVLSLCGGLGFLIASLLLLEESRLAVKSTLEEVVFARKLVEYPRKLPNDESKIHFVSRA